MEYNFFETNQDLENYSKDEFYLTSVIKLALEHNLEELAMYL